MTMGVRTSEVAGPVHHHSNCWRLFAFSMRVRCSCGSHFARRPTHAMKLHEWGTRSLWRLVAGGFAEAFSGVVAAEDFSGFEVDGNEFATSLGHGLRHQVVGITGETSDSVWTIVLGKSVDDTSALDAGGTNDSDKGS